MSLEHDSVGYEESEKYEADPAGTNVPESLYHEMTIGRTAYVLQRIKAIWHEIMEVIAPLLPTADQKAALDANIRLNGENAVASLADVVDVASAIMFPYTFRTGDTIPVAGEVSFNHADPAQATSVRVSSVNKAGVNVWNHLMKLGENDAILVQDIDEANKVYNFDIGGPAVDMGDGGYVVLPGAMFSQGSEPIGDEQTSIVDLKYDGNNTRFLQKNANLSDLQSNETSRTNLDVYSKGETDGLVSAAAGAAAAAQSTADTALANAATAQGTANTALSNAATAQGTASTALTNAATAQSRADAAYSLAESAGSTHSARWYSGEGNASGLLTAAGFSGDVRPYPGSATWPRSGLEYVSIDRPSVSSKIVVDMVIKSNLPYTDGLFKFVFLDGRVYISGPRVYFSALPAEMVHPITNALVLDGVFTSVLNSGHQYPTIYLRQVGQQIQICWPNPGLALESIVATIS